MNIHYNLKNVKILNHQLYIQRLKNYKKNQINILHIFYLNHIKNKMDHNLYQHSINKFNCFSYKNNFFHSTYMIKLLQFKYTHYILLQEVSNIYFNNALRNPVLHILYILMIKDLVSYIFLYLILNDIYHYYLLYYLCNIFPYIKYIHWVSLKT